MSIISELPVLVGIGLLAELLDVQAATIRLWVRRGKWPPADGPGRKEVWLRETILARLRAGKAVSA